MRHKTCSQLHCTVQSKQKNGRECRKSSTIDTGDYDVTHAVHTFKTTCKVRARNNFEFTFQLITAGLLNTEEFQNLKYCIRSKGFLEHLEILLYPTVLEISHIRCQAITYQWCQVASMWTEVEKGVNFRIFV